MVSPTPEMLAGQSLPWAYSDELLPTPEGTTWRTRPLWYAEGDIDPGVLRVGPSRTLRTHSEKLVAAAKWANELDIWIEPVHFTTIGEGGVMYTVCDQLKVNPLLGFHPPGYTQHFLDRDCPYLECNGSYSIAQHECPYCHQPVACAKCHSTLGARNGKLLYSSQSDEVLCEQCGRQCAEPGCMELIPLTSRLCREHGVFYNCSDCEQEFDFHNVPSVVLNERQFCPACAGLRCHVCGDRPEEPLVPNRTKCWPCFEIEQAARTESIEVSPMTAEDWLMPSMPDRPIRLVSIEQEFESRDGVTPDPYSAIRRRDSQPANAMAKALYDKGLSPYGEMAGYHSSGHALPCHIETDSSVTSGGELIINRLKLNESVDAAHMAAIQTIVKERLDLDEVRFTVKCGTHVHIDLHGYTIPDTRNLVTIYSYIEDVIYRLGSAGYKDHREILHGGEYSLPIRKDKWGDIKEFGVKFLRNADHTDSLNLQHFYKSLQTCKCGAIEFGSMSECTCIRKKCTAEWRVFNGTGDPRKLHAYIAVVQAVTAWCQDRQLDVEEFDAMEFQVGLSFAGQTTLKHAKMSDMWKERLTWMFANLPLTDAERESIIYCIETGPMAYIGAEFIESLRLVERIREPGRVLAIPAMADRDSTPDHPYGFNSSGYCNNCSETRRHCRCADEELQYQDEIEPF
jgi:hypothetical protein